VGTNGIIECTFLSKDAHRTNIRLPVPSSNLDSAGVRVNFSRLKRGGGAAVRGGGGVGG
jgi:hypothetical protein